VPVSPGGVIFVLTVCNVTFHLIANNDRAPVTRDKYAGTALKINSEIV